MAVRELAGLQTESNEDGLVELGYPLRFATADVFDVAEDASETGAARARALKRRSRDGQLMTWGGGVSPTRHEAFEDRLRTFCRVTEEAVSRRAIQQGTIGARFSIKGEREKPVQFESDLGDIEDVRSLSSMSASSSSS